MKKPKSCGSLLDISESLDLDRPQNSLISDQVQEHNTKFNLSLFFCFFEGVPDFLHCGTYSWKQWVTDETETSLHIHHGSDLCLCDVD